MKNTKLILVVMVALCFASCDFTQPNTDEAATKVVEVGSTVITEETMTEETPYEWDFDLMWQIFMAMPYQGYDMDNVNTVQSVREKTRQTYDGQRKKNVLSVKTFDPIPCGYYVDMAFFKYQEADKLFVFYTSDEDCGGCNYDSRSYVYDLNNGTLTEIPHPIPVLEARDFFKEEIPASQLAEMVPFEQCENGNFYYEFNYDKADLLVECTYIYPMKDRSFRLAFEWNGNEFVRQPEADVSGFKISKNGFFDLFQSSKIPDSLSDFNVERKTFLSDDDEAIRYVYTKGDELVMEIEPDFDNKGYTDNVGIIMIYSERYLTLDGFHVGSLINDLINYYGEDVYAYTIEDGLLAVDAAGLQFVLEREDYEGELPEENLSACVRIDPTFKPDATVKSIRIYLWEF